MTATYNEIQDFAKEARRLALEDGCRRCGKQARSLELRGDMPLSRLTRDGYGIEEIRKAIEERGWFCRGCARGINNRLALEKLGEWRTQQKKQSAPDPEDKMSWSEDRQFEYIYSAKDLDEQYSRAEECFSGETLRELKAFLGKG